ncbi:MAG: hypothetical protein NT001_00260 [Candidatus Woesearchaeota archaeon]|nr:hypothetical protein [Candidatus Woesearchaeota archaeon]
MARSVLKIIFWKIFGFIMFLILLGIANIVALSINNAWGMQIISFMNENIPFFFLIMIIDIINEIFWSFYFPFNVFAPITSALLSILIITLIYKLAVMNPLMYAALIIPFTLIYILVPVMVLIVGYILIVARGGRPKHAYDEGKEKNFRRKREMKMKNMEKGAQSRKGKKVEWEDIGNEFKLVLYNLGREMNNLFDKNNKKRRK